jgi:hypothetical protein
MHFMKYERSDVPIQLPEWLRRLVRRLFAPSGSKGEGAPLLPRRKAKAD